MKLRSAMVMVVVWGGCTKTNPSSICHDGACTDPEHAFCDIDGALSGEPGACITVACAPGELQGCRNHNALVCNSAGNSYDEQLCASGCVDALGCLPFLPSNGLAATLVDAQHEADAIWPSGIRVDTDTGIVQDAHGTPIIIKSALVAQVGAPSVRVFEARSFSIADVTITGSLSIAMVAVGTISIAGLMSARAHGSVGGPGAQTTGPCKGGDFRQASPGGCTGGPPRAFGSGGGGNYQRGGFGAPTFTTDVTAQENGGLPTTGYSPLLGGCEGGSQIDYLDGSKIDYRGGGGGGALQLVSLTQIVLTSGGRIDLGGGGGESSSGGGSGGTLILEAPQVSLSGDGTGITANGGAGGGCAMTGPDATSDLTPAHGPSCANYFGGDGGTGAAASGNACRGAPGTCLGDMCPVTYGGGGGSVGRARIGTHDGTYMMTGNPALSVHLDTATLVPAP
ncbi:MAG TPA: hypothetical protein VGC42_32625 [Kofleriaceae bacterium]